MYPQYMNFKKGNENFQHRFLMIKPIKSEFVFDFFMEQS